MIHARKIRELTLDAPSISQRARHLSAASGLVVAGESSTWWRTTSIILACSRLRELGAVDGVPLCFTDGATLADGRIVFTAVAENTEDAHADVPCLAAAVGILDPDGRLQCIERLEPTHKVEGVHAWLDGALIRLLLVADADDVDVAGMLLSATLPSDPA